MSSKITLQLLLCFFAVAGLLGCTPDGELVQDNLYSGNYTISINSVDALFYRVLVDGQPVADPLITTSPSYQEATSFSHKFYYTPGDTSRHRWQAINLYDQTVLFDTLVSPDHAGTTLSFYQLQPNGAVSAAPLPEDTGTFASTHYKFRILFHPSKRENLEGSLKCQIEAQYPNTNTYQAVDSFYASRWKLTPYYLLPKGSPVRLRFWNGSNATGQTVTVTPSEESDFHTVLLTLEKLNNSLNITPSVVTLYQFNR